MPNKQADERLCKTYNAMDAKEPLTKLLTALTEIEIPVTRQLLLDYVTGRKTREIEENELFDRDTYGIGEAGDDEYWSTIVDAAYDNKYIRQVAKDDSRLVVSSEGKRFARKPVSIIIPDDEPSSDGVSGSGDIDTLLDQAQKERVVISVAASPHSKRQIKLITAIDRRIALDDFAESEGLGLDEVLDDLEALVRQKRWVDITYFTDEVLGEECMEELLDYFKQTKTDSIEAAAEDYGDTYNTEELRLARIVYRMSKR